jgi:ABC-2 type transport system ATP-binding protein
MTEDIAVKIDKVSKNFVLPHLKPNSLKSIFTGFYQRNNTSKGETQHALHDISFEIKKGEFFGIVGRNGSGKSTLLKILAGIYQPTSGAVTTRGKLVPFIELGVGFNPELTGRENVFLNGAMLGFTESEIFDMYDEIVAFAELERFMDQKLKNYSSGMQVRLAFSMATRAKADILLVDEVLAVGDADFQRKCFKYFRNLKDQKKTVVFVSHDMNAIQEYCDRAILIEKNELILEGSSYDVGMAYTRMFIDTPSSAKAKTKKRWGSGGAKYTKVDLQSTTLKHDQELRITVKVVVNKYLEELILGFTIREKDGKPLVGTNTKINKCELKSVQPNTTISMEWIVPNVFNDGVYLIDMASQGQDYIETYDSWQNAASFTVERFRANPYIMHPAVKVANLLVK